MRDYHYFCLYYPERRYYNLIIMGAEMPISKCCRKLLIFQFDESLRVFCSGCSETPLVERPIESRPFIESILNTPNTLPLGSVHGKVHGGRYVLGRRGRPNESESSLYQCEPGSYGIGEQVYSKELNSDSAEDDEEEF